MIFCHPATCFIIEVDFVATVIGSFVMLCFLQFHGVLVCYHIELHLHTPQVMAAFREDPSPMKLNLGFGVYRTEVGFSLYSYLFLIKNQFH